MSSPNVSGRVANQKRSLKYTAFRSLEIWKHLAEKFSSIKKSAGDPTIQQFGAFCFCSCRLHSRFWVRQFRSIWSVESSSHKKNPRTASLSPSIKLLHLLLRWSHFPLLYMMSPLEMTLQQKYSCGLVKLTNVHIYDIYVLFYVYHSAQTCSVWPSELRPCDLHKGKFFLKMKKIWNPKCSKNLKFPPK